MMKKTVKHGLVIALVILNLSFITRAVYADCDLETCGGGNVPAQTQYSPIYYLEIGAVIAVIVAFAMFALTKIRGKINK
jgi:hypothetical protein